MRNLLHTIAALTVATGLSIGAAPAADEVLIGVYQTPDGTQDYQATLCGDGTQLCVQLVGIHGKEDKPKNQKYIGTYIIKEFAPSGQNKWRGTVTIKEESIGGDVIIDPGKTLYVKACAYIFVCVDMTLNQLS